jgi:murein DD-endopeptidase MepM/ murein hydrolase activator NlpD
MDKLIKLKHTFGRAIITQYFGRTRFAELNSGYYPAGGHTGIDFGIPEGTPINATHDGIIVQDDDIDKSAKGIYIVIVDPKQLIATHYYHLNGNTVELGQNVRTGDVIGYSGSTGLSTAPHLHFGLCRVNAAWIRLDKDNGTNGFIDPLDKELVKWKY